MVQRDHEQMLYSDALGFVSKVYDMTIYDTIVGIQVEIKHFVFVR